MAKKSGTKGSLTALSDGPYKDDAAHRKAYQAESDARALLQAAVIRKDKARLAAAKQWARERADEFENVIGITDDKDK